MIIELFGDKFHTFVDCRVQGTSVLYAPIRIVDVQAHFWVALVTSLCWNSAHVTSVSGLVQFIGNEGTRIMLTPSELFEALTLIRFMYIINGVLIVFTILRIVKRVFNIVIFLERLLVCQLCSDVGINIAERIFLLRCYRINWLRTVVFLTTVA